jgi:hypothetical protein
VAVITRRRPGIPADYGVSQAEEGMLEWGDVAAALQEASVFWIATTRPDGAPHLIPIWGAWVGTAGYIEGGPHTRWARNLVSGSAVHLGVDHAGLQVMVRGGAAQEEVDATLQSAIADGYEAKYPYRPEGSDFWAIRPGTVLAWSTSSLESFGSTPTEFVFEEAP